MNKQLLIYAQSPELRALLEMRCKGLMGFNPMVSSDLEEVSSMLELLTEVDFIILESPEKCFLDKIKINPGIKNIFVLGYEHKVEGKMRFFPTKEIENFLEQLGFLLRGGLRPQGWLSIPLEMIVHIKKLPFDLYVKIAEGKYIKRIPAHEEVDLTTIAVFKAKGLQELFCEREHKRDFSQLLINSMLNKVDENYGNKREELKAKSEVFMTVKDIVIKMGMSPRVMEVCTGLISEIEADASQQGKTLSDHMDLLRESSEFAFHYRFIEMTCLVGGQLLRVMGSENWEEQLKKLIFASFFCDITLNNPELLHILDESSLHQLGPLQYKMVNEHAVNAANIVAAIPGAPKDVVALIKQHHGSLDGHGLPHKKELRLTDLSKCLIISQELSYGILKDSSHPSLETLKGIVRMDSGSALQELVETFETTKSPRRSMDV